MYFKFFIYYWIFKGSGYFKNLIVFEFWSAVEMEVWDGFLKK